MKRYTEVTRNITYALYALIISAVLFVSFGVLASSLFTLAPLMIGTMIISGLSMYLYTTIDISKESSIQDVKGQILSALILSGTAVALVVYSAFNSFNTGAISLVVFLVLIMAVRGLFTFRKHFKEGFI